ncbi:MAG: PEP-CTERM sorting domain-containing protein [Verrucomicrobia bacterium]|nr:PEP-CTERM sorting domain-containing protein [Verrucomicrobiota bacterium]MCH8525625.1 PEP-CTERM sorting domain-containing protein [Kiritimatiellia bacterium]
MKKKMMLLIAALCSQAVFAATIAVQLTGDGWATATNALGNGNSVMTGANIQPATGYSGPAFRGGAVATDTIIGDWQISNNGGSNVLLGKDVFRLSLGSTVSQTETKFHHGVIFFDQSSFGNGLDAVAGGVTLNSETSLSYTAKRVSGNPSRIGYVLQADGNYFLHQIAYNDNERGTGQGHLFTLTDPTAVTWNTFDPTVSLSSFGPAATPDFTKVTGIGLWFENARDGSATTGLDFRVGEITFAAIPEPSTLALLGIALGSAVLFRRRKA